MSGGVETPCMYCGRPVPDDVSECPHCGAPAHFQQRGPRRRAIRVFLTLFVLLVVAAFIAAFVAPR